MQFQFYLIFKIKHWKYIIILKFEISLYPQSLEMIILKLLWYILCGIIIYELCSVIQRGKCRKLMTVNERSIIDLSLHHQHLSSTPSCLMLPVLKYFVSAFCTCMVHLAGSACTFVSCIQRQVTLQLFLLTKSLCQESHFHLNLFVWQGKTEPKRTQATIPLTDYYKHQLSHACHPGGVLLGFWQLHF